MDVWNDLEDKVPTIQASSSIEPNTDTKLDRLETNSLESLKHFYSAKRFYADRFLEEDDSSFLQLDGSNSPVSARPHPDLLEHIYTVASELVENYSKSEQSDLKESLSGQILVSIGILMEEYLKNQILVQNESAQDK